jgi:hypothetical protein
MRPAVALHQPERDCPKTCQLTATFSPWYGSVLWCRARGLCMRGLLDDVLLFSCVGAFYLGLVLAAASLLG